MKVFFTMWNAGYFFHVNCKCITFSKRYFFNHAFFHCVQLQHVFSIHWDEHDVAPSDKPV